MKKEEKVKLRGFTLVELIVVVAVFGLLLAAALSILGPVNNIFRSTVSYADGSAMIDNVSKYVEDNLRYSNRLRIYDSVSVGDEGTFVDKYVKELVSDFRLKDSNRVFSQKIPDEKVYVMKIDNPNISRADLDNIEDIATLPKSYLSSGRISLWVYDVEHEQWRRPKSDPEPDPDEPDPEKQWSDSVIEYKKSAVNEAFYNRYLFTTSLEESYSATTTDVSNLYLKLNVFYDEKPWDATTSLVNTHLGNVISFPLVNLVSSSSILQEQIYFYKPGFYPPDTPDYEKRNPDSVDKDHPESVFRYSYNKGAIHTDSNIADGVDIYFVFTKAPHIENY